MSEFGQQLRQERESRGIALESIIEATKISSHYLLALEAGNFDHLPGGVFNKGIMRGYARVVGLDEETWINRFMSAYQSSGQLKDDDASWIAFAENVGKTRVHETQITPAPLRWAGVAVLVVLLAALGWFLWHFVGNKIVANAVVPTMTISADLTAQG